MIEKPYATQAKDKALQAITDLTAILSILEEKSPAEDFAKIKKAVGLSIGKIQTDILDIITRYHPELDELKAHIQ